MSVRRTGDRDTALHRLGQLARAELSGDVSVEQASEARWRFRETLARETAGRRASRWVGGAAAAAAVAAGLLLYSRTWRHVPLTFEVDAPAVDHQDYLLVPSTAPSAHVHFSDGSDLTLAPGARGRIVAIHADGAAIGLESGRATLRVVHRPGTRWSVDAGPFAIAVTGTAFDVGWSGARELLDVRLRSGSVTIRGPLASAGIQLNAGQRLIANLKTNQLRIEHLTDDVAENDLPDEPEKSLEPGLSPDDVSPHGMDVAPPARAGASAPNGSKASWTKRVAAGDFEAVLADAQRAGLDAVLTRSPLADLVALADAARYARRSDVARRALVAQRERFPMTTAARTAAFLLGRLSEGEPEEAIGWYDRYLREAPNGEFADEALGRKLIAVQRSSGAAGARPIAEQYLRRFPRGAYATRARELAPP